MRKGKVFAIIVVLLILSFIGKLIPKTCAMDGCHNAPWRSSRYCAMHDPFYEGTMIYERNHSNKNSYSSTYYSNNTKSNSSSSTKSNSSYSTYSSKKTEMPDCDDYDSYEDFMDDWDGFMPDGSDAEDYWEDW